MPNEKKTSALESLALVMGEVRAVGKNDRNEQQRFMFRGIDAVMNAVGPALRKHGAAVVPTRIVNRDVKEGTTKSGAAMTKVALEVEFTWFGPDGSSFTGVAVGEANDMADKATSKAHSVALRTFLLQTLCLPTHDPDPDAEYIEQAPCRQNPTSRGDANAARSALREVLNTSGLWEWGRDQLMRRVGQDVNTTNDANALWGLVDYAIKERDRK